MKKELKGYYTGMMIAIVKAKHFRKGYMAVNTGKVLFFEKDGHVATSDSLKEYWSLLDSTAKRHENLDAALKYIFE